jgi:YHS domain-containing protein
MHFLKFLAAALVGLVLATSASAGSDIFTNKKGVAIRGYDPVAYFTQSDAVKGNKSITAEHNGAKYQFSSDEHKALFVASPEKYLPAYGGYCAFGVAMAVQKFPTDPKAWTIVDGTLYLNLNPKVKKRWSTDIPGFINGSENNWPLIAALPQKDLAKGKRPAGVTVGPQ